MMYRLDPGEYERVRPLYTAWRPYLAIFAVIDHTCPGRIYVDDLDDPQTAILWDHAEGELYLGGGEPGAARDPSLARALNDCIRHRIRPYAEANLPDLSEYTLYCDTAVWGDQLDVVLDGLNPMQHRRRLYVLKEPRVNWRTHVPKGYEMVPVDEPLFARRDLVGIDTLNEWVLGDWRSAAEFAARDVGFCLIHGDELVSWCASEYTCEPFPGAGKMCHLGIYTSERYRRQGFATLVASATAERCLESGITDIGWHCWDANMASAATAQKVGFELLRDQPVYNGCWNLFDNLLLQAHYHAQARRMLEAVACWEGAFAMWEAKDPEALNAPHCRDHPDTIAWCYYTAARARAGWGDAGAALAHLHRAIDNGWANVQRVRTDERFATLHDMPEWETLLSRLADAATS
jgi:RimJ/RimL family protein N-acetyltransferase